MATPCTLDASFILTLADAAALDLVWANTRYEWKITPVVRGEILSRAARAALQHALLAGRLSATEPDLASSEAAALADWVKRVDPGEAEAIAVALSRGWLVALEDLHAQRQVDRQAGRGHWINSGNVLLDAVDDGRVTLGEADATFRNLNCYRGYARRGIRSLADLPHSKR
ncbi:MAG: hypothetical protein ACRELD_11825 [Longimicrobiales bacterium]